MMGPRGLVHAFGQLTETLEVGGAQVQRVAGATEVKAAVGGQLALRVLADVPAVLDLPAGDLEASHAYGARRERGQHRLAAVERTARDVGQPRAGDAVGA